MAREHNDAYPPFADKAGAALRTTAPGHLMRDAEKRVARLRVNAGKVQEQPAGSADGVSEETVLESAPNR